MLKGSELMEKRKLFLYQLYEKGAIAPNSAIDAADLQIAIGVNDPDFESLYENLHRAGLVESERTWAALGGEVISSIFKLWLTSDGFQEAWGIAQAGRTAVTEQLLKKPLGFQVPDKNK